MSDLYKILGVERAATDAEIKRAFQRLASRYHPDKNLGEAAKGAEAMFKEVRAAYELLSDPEARKRYDETGATQAPKTIAKDVEECLLNLFKQALAADDGRSPIDIVKHILSDIQEQLQHHKQVATKKVARLTRRSGKFKTKGERNLLQMLIDQQLADLDREICHYEHQLDVAREARKQADDYESLEEARLPPVMPDPQFGTGYTFAFPTTP